MYSLIKMPLACLLILSYTFIFYRIKKRLYTMTSKVFGVMTVFSIIHLIAAAVTEYAVNNSDTVSETFFRIWYIIFLVSITCICVLILYYFLLYIERKNGFRQRVQKYTLLAVTVLALAAEIFLPFENDTIEQGAYSFGMKVIALYCVVIYTMAMLLFTSLHYQNIIENDKSRVLVASIMVFIGISVIQIIFPHLILTDLAITMIMLGIMVNTEDSHRYISYGTGLYNELGCMETLHELLLMKPHFKIGVYVFLGDSRDITAAMLSIKKQLPEKKCKVICGTMADNVLIVLPLCGLTKSIRFPEILPKPEIVNGNLNYSSEIFEFDYEKTISEVVDSVRNYKIKYEENSLQRDELTGLLRRSAFMRQVDYMISKGKGFTFLMVDVDDFKLVNDIYGHRTGDNVLRHIANILISALTPYDAICRIGGDEYAAALFGVTDEKIICDIIERIKKYLTISNGLPDDNLTVTLSFGAKICSADDKSLSFSGIYSEADDALYRSKDKGKNCLHIAP